MKEPNKDHLKDFVQEHRDEFDVASPPAMDFTNMGSSTQEEKGPKMIPIYWLYRVAAVFVVLLGVGVFWVLNTNPVNETTAVAEVEDTVEQPDFSLSELSPEMAELEEYYSNELISKQAELEALGYGDAIAEELGLLDEEFHALRDALGENVDNHFSVHEMVKNSPLTLDL